MRDSLAGGALTLRGRRPILLARHAIVLRVLSVSEGRLHCNELVLQGAELLVHWSHGLSNSTADQGRPVDNLPDRAMLRGTDRKRLESRR